MCDAAVGWALSMEEKHPLGPTPDGAAIEWEVGVAGLGPYPWDEACVCAGALRLRPQTCVAPQSGGWKSKGEALAGSSSPHVFTVILYTCVS